MAIAKFPTYPSSIPVLNTETYLRVLREADVRNNFVPGPLVQPTIDSNRPDGLVNRSELESYQKTLGQQLQWLNFFQQYFGTWFGGIFGQYSQRIQEKSDATSTMLDYFQNFTKAVSDRGQDVAISAEDIRAVARRDSQPDNISGRDVNGPNFDVWELFRSFLGF